MLYPRYLLGAKDQVKPAVSIDDATHLADFQLVSGLLKRLLHHAPRKLPKVTTRVTTTAIRARLGYRREHLKNCTMASRFPSLHKLGLNGGQFCPGFIFRQGDPLIRTPRHGIPRLSMLGQNMAGTDGLAHSIDEKKYKRAKKSVGLRMHTKSCLEKSMH